MTPLGQKVAAARQNYEESISAMNEALSEINEATGGIGLPSALHFPFRTSRFVAFASNNEIRTEFLTYGVWRDVWQLCYSVQLGESSDIEFKKPILDCTLDVRFAALKVLPDFIRELFSAFDKQAEEIVSSLDDAFSSFPDDPK